MATATRECVYFLFIFIFIVSSRGHSICRTCSLFRLPGIMILNSFFPFSFAFFNRVHTAHVVVLIPRVCIVFSIPVRHFISITVLTRSAQLHYYRKTLDIYCIGSSQPIFTQPRML
jgi:hypothetical protein